MENPFIKIEQRLVRLEELIQSISSQSHSESPHDDLMGVDKAAEFLNLSVPTVYSKVSKGELPCMKKSKRLYFSKNDLYEYIKTGRKPTNEEIKNSYNKKKTER